MTVRLSPGSNVWRGTIATLVFATGVLGCNQDEVPSLATGDIVAFVQANKGNEVVIEKDGHRHRVRLVGVHTFDPSAFERQEVIHVARLASAATSDRLRDKALRVALERVERDRRGRFIGYLEVDGIDAGRALIADGLGAVYTEYPFTREAEYRESEDAVRAAGGALWGTPAVAQRVRALRETWATVRERRFGSAPQDPVLVEAP